MPSSIGYGMPWMLWRVAGCSELGLMDAWRVRVPEEGRVRTNAVRRAIEEAQGQTSSKPQGRHAENPEDEGHFPKGEAARELLHWANRSIETRRNTPVAYLREALDQLHILFLKGTHDMNGCTSRLSRSHRSQYTPEARTARGLAARWQHLPRLP